MAKRKWQGVTRQQVENISEIITWLKVTGGTPLEVGVMEEVRERLTVNAHNGALVRVRIKNLGRMPAAQAETAPATSFAALRAMRPSRVAWTFDEHERLRTLYQDGLTHLQIGEALGRTEAAVSEKISRLHLSRQRPYNHSGNHQAGHPAHDVLARAREVRQRRIAEGRRERREA